MSRTLPPSSCGRPVAYSLVSRRSVIYDHREHREVHYPWPEGYLVEEVLHEQLSGPAESVAPDGGRTGDVRDRLVVDKNAESQDDLEPHTKRAVAEAMEVSLLPKGSLRGTVRV